MEHIKKSSQKVSGFKNNDSTRCLKKLMTLAFVFLIFCTSNKSFANSQMIGGEDEVQKKKWTGNKIGETTTTINIFGIYKWERTRINCSKDSDANCLETTSSSPGSQSTFTSYNSDGSISNVYEGILDQEIVEYESPTQTEIEFVLKVNIEE